MGFSRKVADLPSFMRVKPKKGRSTVSPKARKRLLREMDTKWRAAREAQEAQKAGKLL
jgi:hypothetical protein